MDIQEVRKENEYIYQTIKNELKELISGASEPRTREADNSAETNWAGENKDGRYCDRSE